jgi:hypothetical protein
MVHSSPPRIDKGVDDTMKKRHSFRKTYGALVEDCLGINHADATVFCSGQFRREFDEAIELVLWAGAEKSRMLWGFGFFQSICPASDREYLSSADAPLLKANSN